MPMCHRIPGLSENRGRFWRGFFILMLFCVAPIVGGVDGAAQAGMTIVGPQNGLHLVPPLCSQGTENWKGRCVAVCPPGRVHLPPNGVCATLKVLCPLPNEIWNGHCVPKCAGLRAPSGQCVCPPGFEPWGGKCPPKCPPDQVRAPSGQCVCPPGRELWGGRCVPKCAPGQTHVAPIGRCLPHQ